MSKKPSKAQASSTRVAISNAGPAFGSSGFGSGSPLSYLAEQPDLSALSDPNVVVSFKNLTKKDSTTKAKALEDLQSQVSDDSGGVEEAFLEAWVGGSVSGTVVRRLHLRKSATMTVIQVKVYPRASIDLSRRVRQLAHMIMGKVAACSGKRMARHMPSIVGSWLAGLHDGDKSVMRAVEDSLKQVFPTPEKQTGLTRVYQGSVLMFCKNAIMNETSKTLSDERSTSVEDSEAVYARVVSSCVGLVNDLLTKLESSEIQKQHDSYKEILSADSLWSLLSSNDTQVRRSLYRLLQTCLHKHQGSSCQWLFFLMWRNCTSIIVQNLFAKSTIRHQTGSALEFSESLVALTESHPDVWKGFDDSKTPCLERVQILFKQGSHMGPPRFWLNITRIVQTIPYDCLPSETASAEGVLNALLTGITRKDEPRSNAESAWTSYFDLTAFFTAKLSEHDRHHIIAARVLPVVRQYVRPLEEHFQHSINGTIVLTIIQKALKQPVILEVVREEICLLAEKLVEDIRMSAPEQSKDFERSQDTAMAETQRFFSLQAQNLGHAPDESTIQQDLKIKFEVIQQCIDLLNARKGKPYGAAGCIEAAVADMNSVSLDQNSKAEPLRRFVTHELPSLSFTPSQKQLFAVLYCCQNTTFFKEAWNATLNEILGYTDSAEKLATTLNFISSSKIPRRFTPILESTELQKYMGRCLAKTLDDGSEWTVLDRLSGLQQTTIASTTFTTLLVSISESLLIEEKAGSALTGLRLIASKFRLMLKPFLTTEQGSVLIQNLLRAEESPDDDVAQGATDVGKTIQLIVSGAGSEVDVNPSLALLHNGFYEATDSSLSVSNLIQLAERMLKSNLSEKSSIFKEILPDPCRWQTLLRKHGSVPPAEELAVNEPGSIVYLVENRDPHDRKPQSASLDADGLSPVLRMACYVVELEELHDLLSHLEEESDRIDVVRVLCLTLSMIGIQLEYAHSNMIWDDSRSAIRNEIESFHTKADGIAQGFLIASPGDEMLFAALTDPLRNEASGESSWAFYNAMTYSNIVKCTIEQNLVKKPGNEVLSRALGEVKIGTSKILSAFQIVAFGSSLSNVSTTARLTNELIADLTGFEISTCLPEALIKLIFLNLLFQQTYIDISAIAKQRLIFFVKHIVSWLSLDVTNISIQVEVCKSLTKILPAIFDVYGDHWAEIVRYIVSIWLQPNVVDDSYSRNSNLPLWHATLSLCWTLDILKLTNDSAEDILEAMTESAGSLHAGLLSLASRTAATTCDANKPLHITNESIARQLSEIKNISDVQAFYPLVSAQSRPIQKVASMILGRHIRKTQQDVSVDAALEKSTVRLPEELVSLIIQAPALDVLDRVATGTKLPSPALTYFLGWLLVFDHFPLSSERVKTDYAAHLKAVDSLKELLNLIFNFEGLAKGKPVDASKFEPTAYSFDVEDSPLKDLQWLLIRLYYLCLKHLPSLTKSWWIDNSSRQLKPQVETWTGKYFSPLLIREALDIVCTWNSSPDSPFDSSSSDDIPTLKINPLSSTLTFSKPIDEQTLLITIRLPPSFPLSSPLVEGTHRVAVTERQWRSWLLQTQGVIQFSDNNLIEGLLLLKRNVEGALKGQVECAICYSVVSGERQVPNKKCATCANAFHGACLYRWFKSSNGSSCPLCRTAFNYA